jgi:hypothetical protein
MLLLLMLLLATVVGQDPKSIAGRWHGESICVKAAWNAACHDEEVVYDVAPDSTQPGRMRFHASKIVAAGPSGWATWTSSTARRQHLVRRLQQHAGPDPLGVSRARRFADGRVVDRETGRVARAVRAARGG